MPNLNQPEFDQLRDRPGFVARRARIGHQAGAEKLGVSLWELAPGEAAYPYHWHLAEEELLVVWRGSPSLRTPDGWRELDEGEVVVFPAGERGAHQVANRSDGPASFLAFSTMPTAEVVVYPDSGKLGAYEELPGGGGLRELFRREDAVDYYDGEEPPQPAS